MDKRAMGSHSPWGGVTRLCYCIDSLRFLALGGTLGTGTHGQMLIQDIFADMGAWLHKVNNEGQLRWLGPEKGVTGMALASIVNYLWDLKARIEGKSVWKVLVDLSPEELNNLMDFT